MNLDLDSDGSAVVSTRPQAGRLVAGAALALIGAAIGWQIVRAISNNQASTHAAWTAYVPAVLLFGGFALVFFIPGVMMLLYKRTGRIDPSRHEVTESQRYLGYSRRRSYSLSRFKTVVLARRSFQRGRRHRSAGSSSRGRSYSVFIVELAGTGSKPLRIVMAQQEAPAREAAAKLAAMTRLALDDRVERERERERSGQDMEDDED